MILPFAGYLAARGELDLVGVVASGSAGSAAGATVWFVLGRSWGSEGMHRFVERHGHWLLLDIEDVTRAETWFNRHQRRATFFGRLMPGVRSLISVPAGVARMPAPVFLLYTIAGTVLWTAALTIAGYLLADAYEKIRDVVRPHRHDPRWRGRPAFGIPLRQPSAHDVVAGACPVNGTEGDSGEWKYRITPLERLDLTDQFGRI